MSDKRRKIVQILALLLALVSMLGAYLSWRDYQQLRKDMGVRHDTTASTPEVAEQSAAVDWLEYPYEEQREAWREFVKFHKLYPESAGLMLSAVDFSDPEFDVKLYEEVQSSSKPAQRFSAIERICRYDMTHPGLPAARQAVLSSLFSRLLKKCPDVQVKSICTTVGMAIRYQEVDLERYLVYAEIVGPLDKDFFYPMLKHEGYQLPKYAKKHLEQMSATKRKSIEPKVVELFGEGAIEN